MVMELGISRSSVGRCAAVWQRLSLNVCCRADLSSLANNDNVCYEKEEGDSYQHILFFPEGGVGG